MKLLERLSLIALTTIVCVAHYAIDPPLWASILGVPVCFAIGAGNAEVWDRIRHARRKGATW